MKKGILSIVCIALFFAPNLAAQSRGLEVIAKSLGGEHAVVGKQYAVFIAIDAYKEWMPLKNPVRDAIEIRDILTSRYYIDQVYELYNGEATKAGVLRLFDTLINIAKPEDSILIYYAGHGQLDRTDTGFWIPVDAGTDAFEQTNWIPNIQVRNNIGKMLSRHVSLISDSCFSGDILNPTRGAAPTIDQSYFSKAWTRVSRQVLTSGASESVPDQSEFSQQLKIALRGNTQPYLDPLMLYQEIRLGMKRTTPLFGDLKDSGHQEGASFLLFLRGSGDAGPVQAATASLAAPGGGKAELSISASMEGAEVFVDGVSYGKAPALASGLPAGRKLAVSARAGAFSATAEVTLAPKELKEISLELERMKANLMIATSAKDLALFLDGDLIGPLGSGVFRDLSAGEYSLELKGEGLYYQGKVSLKGDETTKLSAEPWAVGRIAYEAPAEAWVIITGDKGFNKRVSGTGTLDILPIGSYAIRTKDIGYGVVQENLVVKKNQTATFKLEAPGSLVISGIPANVTILRVDGHKRNLPARGESLVVTVRPGQELPIVFTTANGSETSLLARVEGGQSQSLTAPAGLLAFDWLPAGASMTLDGRSLPISVSASGQATSESLLAQDYALAVALPGIGTYTERATVIAGGTTSIDKLSVFALDALKAQKKKRGKLDGAGWVSLGIGILGAAGAGVSYFLGAEAMDSYESSTLSSDIDDARGQVELYGALFAGTAALGGGGLALSPVFFASGPKAAAIDSSIKALQAGIEALKAQRK